MAEPAELLARRAPGFLSDAQTCERQARSRLTAAARHQVRVHRERLVRKASSIGRSAPSRLESREAAVHGVAARLGPVSLGHLGRQDERLRLVAAAAVRLRRGAPARARLQPDPDGGRRGSVRSAGDVVEGQEIVTRFADGSVRSTVEGADMRQEPEQAQESED